MIIFILLTGVLIGAFGTLAWVAATTREQLDPLRYYEPVYVPQEWMEEEA